MMVGASSKYAVATAVLSTQSASKLSRISNASRVILAHAHSCALDICMQVRTCTYMRVIDIMKGGSLTLAPTSKMLATWGRGREGVGKSSKRRTTRKVDGGCGTSELSARFIASRLSRI